jgi:MoaA/NifB/PqqE/SkfB family radical SAM enzyme
MTVADWRRVIDQAAACGVGDVTLIGGEPTVFPGFTDVVGHALAAGLGVL